MVLPYVDAHAVAKLRQFVHQTDVDVAVGVFQNFFHFRNGGGGSLENVAVQNGPVHGGDDLGSVPADGSYHLGGIFGLIDQVAGIDPLRGEAQIEVLAAFEAGCFFQNGLEQFFGGARIGGGFQHDHTAPVDVGGDGAGGAFHIADVRLLMNVQRRGNADGHKVRAGDFFKIGGGAEHSAFHDLLEIAVHHIADIVMALVHQTDFFTVHVKTDGMKASLGLFDGQRETHIAQTDHSDAHFLAGNLIQQLFL